MNEITSIGPPRPVYSKRRWAGKWVWLFPVFGAVIAGFYGYSYLQQRGPLITIRVASADGLKVGDTPLMHRGVVIGKISDINLSPDHRKALIEVRLERNQEAFAKEGANFWIVRPEVSGTDLRGIGTLFSGPFIDSTPGKGGFRREFSGESKPPNNFGKGLELVVHAAHLEHLEERSPVYYRGIQVGIVRDVRLGSQADRVEARLTVWKRYSPLVRSKSKFWPVSGFDVKGGLLSGVDLKLQSLEALISGGIAFATPDKDMGDPVKEGTDFALEKESKDDWLNWSPHIPIQPQNSEEESSDEAPRNHVHAAGPLASGK